jgi:hypothetical protein
MPYVLHLNTGTRLSEGGREAGLPEKRQPPDRRNGPEEHRKMGCRPYPATNTTFDESRFMARVYGWMPVAFALSAFPTCATVSTP